MAETHFNYETEKEEPNEITVEKEEDRVFLTTLGSFCAAAILPSGKKIPKAPYGKTWQVKENIFFLTDLNF